MKNGKLLHLAPNVGPLAYLEDADGRDIYGHIRFFRIWILGTRETDFCKILDLSDRIRSKIYSVTGSKPELTLSFFTLQPREEKDFAKQIKHALVFYNPDNLLIVFILVCPFIRWPAG